MHPEHDRTKLIDFQMQEVVSVLLLAVVFAFALTFRMWGEGDTVEVAVGLMNWLMVTVGLIVAFFIHEAGHKYAGSLQGAEVRIHAYKQSYIISPLISFWSVGLVPFIVPNPLEVDARPDRRLGNYFKFDTPMVGGYVALGGLIGSCAAIVLFKALHVLVPSPVLTAIILGIILHSVYSMIPFELLALVKLRVFSTGIHYVPGDGVHLFWFSGQLYFIVLLFLVIYGLLALFTTGTYFIISFLMAIIGYAVANFFKR